MTVLRINLNMSAEQNRKESSIGTDKSLKPLLNNSGGFNMVGYKNSSQLMSNNTSGNGYAQFEHLLII